MSTPSHAGWMTSVMGCSSPKTLCMDEDAAFARSMGVDEVALACGSRSMINTRCERAARPAARFKAVVVFATPPFWFAMAITTGTPQSYQERGDWSENRGGGRGTKSADALVPQRDKPRECRQGRIKGYYEYLWPASPDRDHGMGNACNAGDRR